MKRRKWSPNDLWNGNKSAPIRIFCLITTIQKKAYNLWNNICLSSFLELRYFCKFLQFFIKIRVMGLLLNFDFWYKNEFFVSTRHFRVGSTFAPAWNFVLTRNFVSSRFFVSIRNFMSNENFVSTRDFVSKSNFESFWDQNFSFF